jgi:hypothetical protein
MGLCATQRGQVGRIMNCTTSVTDPESLKLLKFIDLNWPVIL